MAIVAGMVGAAASATKARDLSEYFADVISFYLLAISLAPRVYFCLHFKMQMPRLAW